MSRLNQKRGMTMNRQIKSRQRVTQYGEVYTAEREVNAMLDLVKAQTERIESRLLDPACGNGNFLVEALRRKLITAKVKGRNAHEYERHSVLAITSIYGIDILADNVKECQDRLFDIWQKAYVEACGAEASPECNAAVRYILAQNIICGNSLSMHLAGKDGQEIDAPIIVAQWVMIGDQILRCDYLFEDLTHAGDDQADISMYLKGWRYDEKTQSWCPPPVRVFAPVNYWDVCHA